MQAVNWLKVAVATPMLIAPPHALALDESNSMPSDVRKGTSFVSSDAVILLSRIPYCYPEYEDLVSEVLVENGIQKEAIVSALSSLKAMLGLDRRLSLKASHDPDSGENGLVLKVDWDEDLFVDEYTAVIENWLIPLEDKVGRRGFLAVV